MLVADGRGGRLPARDRPGRGRGVAAAAPRGSRLHRAALQALAPAGRRPTSPGSPTTPRPRGDSDAVLRYAPAAASARAEVGAHREAAAQVARALRFADGLPPASRRGSRTALLRVLSHRRVRRGDRGWQRAVGATGELGDPTKEGGALCAGCRAASGSPASRRGRGDGARGGLDPRALPARAASSRSACSNRLARLACTPATSPATLELGRPGDRAGGAIDDDEMPTLTR